MPIVLLAWKGVSKNSLKGFASVRLGKSLNIKDISIHEANGRRWASLPSKPIIDSSGTAKRDDAGKIQYVPLLQWTDREASDRFSEAVVAAIEAEHPDAFASGG